MPSLRKIIEYGLYFFVFLMPWQTRLIVKAGELNNGAWEYGTISLYATDIIILILLSLFLIRSFYIKKFSIFSASRRIQFSNNFQFNNFQTKKPYIGNRGIIGWLAAGLIIITGISIFFSADKILGLYKLGWLILGLGLFWLLRQASYGRLKLIWSLLLGVFIQACLAIGQFLTQSAFPNKWLGLAGHKAGELGAAVIETIGPDGRGERWLRAYGGFDHPNILGGVLAIAVLLLIGELIERNKKNNFQFSIFNFQTIFNGLIFKIFSWLLLIIFTASLFFAFSRAAWLALGVGLAVLIVGNLLKKDWLKQKILAQALLALSAVVFILFLLYPNLVLTRLYAKDRLEVKSTNERVEGLKDSLSIIKKHRLNGVGPGNYTLAVKNEITPAKPSYYYQPVHNTFLLAWSETGIFGLIFFLGLIIYIIILNFQFSIFKQFSIHEFFNNQLKIVNCKLKIMDNDNSANYDISSSILIAMIILLAFDHWLFSLHFGVLFFWLTLGLATRNASSLDCHDRREMP